MYKVSKAAGSFALLCGNELHSRMSRFLRERSAIGQRAPVAGGRRPRLTPEEARRDHWMMLRYIVTHTIAGSIIGIGVGVALMLFDIGGLGTRISQAAEPIIPIFMILAPLASLFGSAAAASAILIMPYERKYEDGQPDN